MIIGFDAGPLSVDDDRLKVGVYRMTLELLSRLSQLDKRNSYRIYSFKKLDLENLAINRKTITNVVLPKTLWHSLWLPLELFTRPVDVFIGPAQSLPRLPQQTKSIVFVYDLTFEKKPEWFAKTYAKMSRNTRSAVYRADHIIAVSQQTKKDIVSFYNIDPKKIEIIPGAISSNLIKYSNISDDRRIIKKYSLPDKYLLFVGTYKQSKNIPNIIRAFSSVADTNINLSLVLVGSNLWLYPEIPSVIKESPFRARIINLGYISDKNLSIIYKHAFCFISPSYNEGFGLTHLEAASFKIPVIASKAGAITQVLGKGAYYADPESIQDISNQITKVMSNPKLKNVKIKLAFKNASKYSWVNTSKMILQVINKYTL